MLFETCHNKVPALQAIDFKTTVNIGQYRKLNHTATHRKNLLNNAKYFTRRLILIPTIQCPDLRMSQTAKKWSKLRCTVMLDRIIPHIRC